MLIPAFGGPSSDSSSIIFNSHLRLVGTAPLRPPVDLPFLGFPIVFCCDAGFLITNPPPEPTSHGGHFALKKFFVEGEDLLAQAAELIGAFAVSFSWSSP